MITTAVILVGGKGKRLFPYTKIVPKPMVDINGKPFLFYLIKKLKKNNISKIYLLTGYKSSIIENYFSKSFQDIDINIIKTPINYETSKRLLALKAIIKEKFILLYGDNFVNLNLKKYLKFQNSNNGKYAFVIKNSNDCDEVGNVILKSRKVYYDEKRNKNYNYVELGYFILDHKVFNFIPKENISFSKVLLCLCKLNKMRPFITKAKYLSITDKQRLNNTRQKLNNLI